MKVFISVLLCPTIVIIIKKRKPFSHPNKFVYFYWTYQTYESQVGVLEEDQTVSSVSYLNIENKNVKNYFSYSEKV